MEFWASRFTLDELVHINLFMVPKLRKVPYHIVHELYGRKYKKVKERMQKGTIGEDCSAKDAEEPIFCAICSDECKKTEERAYFNCGHTYHEKCILGKKINCLICGQELYCYLPVLEGESIIW
ncbi:hypothetical protein BT93_F1773 [Corymbia citriodora subsp. variegata]|nr:hypothetical protein BT93_F1773 [Corymbia citriodora subsp. variegata]